MPTTIRDLLDDESLRLRLLVDGDLDRPLRWVHVTELADASPYLAGDELILTAGVWRGRGTSALKFVRALETRSLAGLGYGVLDAHEAVPRALIRACQRESVPLLMVPVDTPFIAITQRFVQRLSEEREADLRRSLAFTSQLLAAADAHDPSAGMKAIVRVLRRDTGRDAWIADARRRVLAWTGQEPDDQELQAAARQAAADGLSTSTPADVVGLRSGSRITALVGLSGHESSFAARSRLEAALPIVGLVLARQRAVRETERRLAGELVSLVLGRQVHAAAARMSSYGLDPKRPALAIVVAVPDGEAALTDGERWLEAQRLVGVVALRGSELYVIIGGNEATTTSDARDRTETLVSHLGALAAGVGAPAASVATLRKSMVQARHACQLGLRRGGGTIISHELAGSHALLLTLQDQDVLDDFRNSVLAPLEDHDIRHSSDLLPTLHVFLGSGGRWQQTADELNIHVNTLRHRLTRVEEITGRHLDDTNDRVDLWLAIQAPHTESASTQ